MCERSPDYSAIGTFRKLGSGPIRRKLCHWGLTLERILEPQSCPWVFPGCHKDEALSTTPLAVMYYASYNRPFETVSQN